MTNAARDTRRAPGVGTVFLGASLLLAGCAQTPAPSLGLVSVAPSLAASSSPDARLSAARLETARVFRASSGLRSDPGWLRAVAVNPAAAEGERRYGIPLLPEELAILDQRATSSDQVMDAVQAYGRAHPETWGGAYVDTSNGHVVAMIVGDVARNEGALRRLVRPNAPLDVRPAAWALADLKELAYRIAHDGWLAERGYDLIGVGADISRNIVTLELSTADPKAAAVALEHYDARGRLEVWVDGTGVLTMEHGGVSGFAVDATGRAVPGLDVEVVPDVEGAPTGGDIGHETGADGSFRILRLAPVGYTVKLLDSTAPDGTFLQGPDRVLVGSTHVEIASGQIVTVVINVRS